MRSFPRLLICLSLSFFISLPAYAVFGRLQSQDESNESLEKIVEYLKHLGGYLGYQLTQKPPEEKVKATILDLTMTQLIEIYVFDTLLGATPVNTVNKSLSMFAPQSNELYNAINGFINHTFSSPEYSDADPQSGDITANKWVDQQQFQNDPVSQGILNILGTPDSSFCLNYEGTELLENCKYLSQSQVMLNTIGKIPAPDKFFSYDYIKTFLGELNGNILIAPLLYTTDTQRNSGSSMQKNKEEKGLPSQNQAQVASNFIRYVGGLLTPVSLPSQRAYGKLYSQSINDSLPLVERKAAESALAAYLSYVRMYSARISVGLSNLYYIFSKRMPQNLGATDSKYHSSQALSEFQMATRRLFDPTKRDKNPQWIQKINQASSATVQKEIAILLAEINYQLYLNRQQEERVLLTNSTQLLLYTQMLLPDIEQAQQNVDPNEKE